MNNNTYSKNNSEEIFLKRETCQDEDCEKSSAFQRVINSANDYINYIDDYTHFLINKIEQIKHFPELKCSSEKENSDHVKIDILTAFDQINHRLERVCTRLERLSAHLNTIV